MVSTAFIAEDKASWFTDKPNEKDEKDEIGITGASFFKLESAVRGSPSPTSAPATVGGALDNLENAFRRENEEIEKRRAANEAPPGLEPEANPITFKIDTPPEEEDEDKGRKEKNTEIAFEAIVMTEKDQLEYRKRNRRRSIEPKFPQRPTFSHMKEMGGPNEWT